MLCKLEEVYFLFKVSTLQIVGSVWDTNASRYFAWVTHCLSRAGLRSEKELQAHMLKNGY